MGDEIFLIGENSKLIAMTPRAYDSENHLQKLLADYPNLIPTGLTAGSARRRWLPVSREVGIPSEEHGSRTWALDHLFLDQDGVPTLVEVKRSTDTRIRREVVGQMLDYAANAVAYWPLEEIRQQFEKRCQFDQVDPDAELAGFLEAENDASVFWASVKTNLQAGRIRMIFLADAIPPELRRIVEFLNIQMDPAEVLAVEVKQYAGEGVQTFVPRMIGQTAESERKKYSTQTGNGQWDESSFFRDLEARCGATEIQVARKLLHWTQQGSKEVWWGQGQRMGSFVNRTMIGGQEFNIFAVWTYGKIEIYFQWLRKKPAFADKAKRLEFLAKLNAIPGIDLPQDATERRPNIPLGTIASPDASAKFFAVLDWVVATLQGDG